MVQYIKNIFNQSHRSNGGFIALLIVIMVTSLIIVSSVIIALINTSNSLANYQVSESARVTSNIDACVDDALWRIASSTIVTGSFSINATNVACEYQISGIIDGYKYVTSTATSTSAVGNWNRQTVTQVAVSTTPITIYSYRDNITRYNAGATICGDGVVEGSEVCDDGNTTTEGCGDGAVESGSYCNSNCSQVLTLSEVCDDGNAITESCGDGVIENGSNYCNSACSASLTLSETCEFIDPTYYCSYTTEWCGPCIDNSVNCPGNEVSGKNCQNTCTVSRTNCPTCAP